MLQQTPALSSWEQPVGRQMGVRKGYATYLPRLLCCSPWGRCPHWVLLPKHWLWWISEHSCAISCLWQTGKGCTASPAERGYPTMREHARAEGIIWEQGCTKLWNGCSRVVVSGDVSVLGTCRMWTVKSSFASALTASKREACDQWGVQCQLFWRWKSGDAVWSLLWLREGISGSAIVLPVTLTCQKSHPYLS